MKRVLYIIRNGPGLPADETTDLMLVSGVFEQPTTVMFTDDGVYQLLGPDDRRTSINALPDYGINELFVSVDSLTGRGLGMADIRTDIRPVSGKDVRDLIDRHDIVLTD